MAHFEYSSVIPHSRQDVFAWHERPGTFERLAPPGGGLHPIERADGIGPGTRNVFEVGIGPLRRRWTAVHDSYERGFTFRDVMESGPLPAWSHVHRFEDAAVGCRLTDKIDYTPPFGPVGAAFSGTANRWFLTPMFRFRHARTRMDLDRHRAAGLDPLRVGVTGLSGFLGAAIGPYLASGGHEIVRLPRRPGGTDLEGLDAIVHLAAEPIFGLWTRTKREKIRASRVEGTRHLVETMAKMDRPPRVLLTASGIAIHGDGYMAGLVRDWEGAAMAATAFGTRVVPMRLSPVVGSGGGLLGPMLPAFRLGLGASIGDRDASLSWIGLDDVVGAVEHLLSTENLEGPVDLVAPQVVTQRELAKTLGHVLRRPVLAHIPSGVVNRLGGDLGRTITESLAVEPSRLTESGFEWLTPTLEQALRWELKGSPPP